MASKYFRNTGNTAWNVTTNWSATSGGASVGAIPVAGDDVHFDANSGSCIVNVAGACGSLDFTGYSGTITMNNSITLSAASGLNHVTLSATMTIAGTSALISNQAGATSNWTSNGKVWPNLLTLNGSSSPIFNFVDNWTVANLTCGGGAKTVNGSRLTINGNMTINIGTAGTTNFLLNGTGTWSASGNLNNNLEINTAGTITITGTVNYRTGTLKYTAGTVVTTGSTLLIQTNPANVTLNTAGITWNNVTMSGVGTITLQSTLTINGTFTLGAFTISFAGTAGFVANTVVCQQNTSSLPLTFASGLTYRITNSIQAILTPYSNHLQILSSTPGSRANLILDSGCVCNLGYVDFTDIDASSGGRIISVFNGNLINTKNIVSYTEPFPSEAKSFAA